MRGEGECENVEIVPKGPCPVKAAVLTQARWGRRQGNLYE